MTGKKTRTVHGISFRYATEEDYAKLSGWQIGTYHRVTKSELQKPGKKSPAPKRPSEEPDTEPDQLP